METIQNQVFNTGFRLKVRKAELSIRRAESQKTVLGFFHDGEDSTSPQKLIQNFLLPSDLQTIFIDENLILG